MISAALIDRSASSAGIDTEQVELFGDQLCVGIVADTEPVFDPFDPTNAHRALVRKLAFSCNFRDRAVLQLMQRRLPRGGYAPFGSEFVGEVVSIGRAVDGLAIGDRVIGDCHYPAMGPNAAPPGVVTNTASQGLQVLHADKLVRIPDQMTNTEAAGFALGAQTAYAMARRLELQPGDRVIVTAATSNTSLLAIQALANRGARVVATTRCEAARGLLERLGAERVFVVDPAHKILDHHPELGQLAITGDGVSAIVDPLSDIYLAQLAPILRSGGRYITCGVLRQGNAEAPSDEPPLHLALAALIARNVSLIGNCLGTTDDLRAALDDRARGQLTLPIDSTFHGGQVAAFLRRSFADRDRLGKVIYNYE